MPQRLSLALCCCVLLLASACTGERPEADAARARPAAPAATPGANSPATPQPQPVIATAEEARVPTGGAGEASVRLLVADGYHVNANPPSDKFYVGTEVRAAAQAGVTPGAPVYPRGESQKFQFSDKPLSVYEGEVTIRLPLRVDAGAPKGRRTLAATVRVQPCNDKECFPPRDLKADIPVVVE